ncbi:MAG TPA: trehalase family glycosidase [Candidatus Sulfopaludibacter sp.]|nr:trehalase family glycosidase [Candidatus Sulfopaludibacter sp.]
MSCFVIGSVFIATNILYGEQPLDLMQNQIAYLAPVLQGDQPQKPVMGCELSDFGSWYDIAYAGGINRFMLGSVRQGVGPNNEFFNTARDVGVLSLVFQTATGEKIFGDTEAAVTWYPYGWRTVTRHGNLAIESATFFTAFNTVAIYAKVTNTGDQPVSVAPGLLVTARSGYDGRVDGKVTGSFAKDGQQLWFRNARVGSKTTPALYTDTLAIGSTLTPLRATFAPLDLTRASPAELKLALAGTDTVRWGEATDEPPQLRMGTSNPAREDARPTGIGETNHSTLAGGFTSSLDAPAGTAVLMAKTMRLKPGKTFEFVFIVAAAADNETAAARCATATRAFTRSPRRALTQVENDWNGFFSGLPKLEAPTDADLKLYYSAATALRKNRYLRECDGQLYSASFPARGGFNYYFQSDSCWNLLGYLDMNPQWAEGNAVPILDPPCEIMDPHFFWSMWELYSRLPGRQPRHDFAATVYPLLTNAYWDWTNKVDIDGDLLTATPDNWDDNPRYDLIFKEIKYEPGWNSWWNDLTRCCRENKLDDPAPSSQLGYGAVVLRRLALILGKDAEAAAWAHQIQRHRQAIDSLWDGQKGYWIVTYRGTQRDDVLTSSIIYPIFCDLCRDPAKIKRVIEQHILNPKEFNGLFPVPTVAYDDPRYYHQKPPFQDRPGGLWRGNIWMPETWIIVKGLFKYGYEEEAKSMAARLLNMMANQSGSVGPYYQFAHSPAEWYDSRTGLGQNNRAFSWSSAVAMDYLLGNYQNERVLGSNPDRDRTIAGHVREIFDFDSGDSLFKVETTKTVFPFLAMSAADGLPIEQSRRVLFTFSDPGGNFAGSAIPFRFEAGRWQVEIAATGHAVPKESDGWYHAPLNTELALVPRARTAR